MKIFSSDQIKQWDKYTISNEPVTSADLIERAARACFSWLIQNYPDKNNFKIFCGKGNNGADGLAIAGMFIEVNCAVSVYILETNAKGSKDFEDSLSRIQTFTKHIYFIKNEDEFPQLNNNDIIIDALFGTGLNKPPGEKTALLINYINQSNAIIISIDVPGGLFADKTSKGNEVIKAEYTLTFQQYKLAFMMAESEPYFGKIILLDINLDKKFYELTDAQYELTDIDLIKAIYRPRKAFSNKGNFGHACIIAGSYGMMGAAVLAAKGCMRAGAGKLTCVIPEKGYEIMQVSVPEAMCKVSGDAYIKDFIADKNYNSFGIGPGIGLYESHQNILERLFSSQAPMVIDADALNFISQNKKLLSLLPPNCIITPHPKEFDRLFGKSDNDFERVEMALKKSEEYKIYIVLKGHHTLITTPFKRAYFNSTGNAGMAKGGSGDVLTGIITSFLSQGYPTVEACLLGVYLHGLAGDIAAKKYSQEAMIASNITDSLGEGFKHLNSYTYKKNTFVV